MSTWDWIGIGLIAVLVIVTGVIAIWLVVKVIRHYRMVMRPDVPVAAKITFFASIAYAIFPLDLLPDPVLIDDIAVLVGALAYLGHVAKKLKDPDAELTAPGQPLKQSPSAGTRR
ncbi:YkvA family protein [Fodinicola acaciae]|uniref:YkvA family protein n=1 Tax=Fodinicola acaciae TaxID=2681555 RepID=UPI0013D689FE|nr:DUF1232 domain-containing protein [Fodinicola acaciae]